MQQSHIKSLIWHHSISLRISLMPFHRRISNGRYPSEGVFLCDCDLIILCPFTPPFSPFSSPNQILWPRHQKYIVEKRGPTMPRRRLCARTRSRAGWLAMSRRRMQRLVQFGECAFPGENAWVGACMWMCVCRVCVICGGRHFAAAKIYCTRGQGDGLGWSYTFRGKGGPGWHRSATGVGRVFIKLKILNTFVKIYYYSL